MTPELELVIQVSKTTLGQRDRSAIASLARGTLDGGTLDGGGLDWQEVLRLAEWYQVGGFLASHLNKSDFPVETPREIRDAAYRLAEENRIRYLFFIEPELDRILATLNRERIQVIALKGVALNRLVYRDLGLRPIGDVDLLIQEQHLSRARDLFDELGYSQNESLSDDSRKIDNYHYCPRLLSPDGSVEIELHRHVVRRSSPLYFEVDDLWSQAREKEIGDQNVWILGPVDLISHLCLKFFVDRGLRQHSYAAVRQLADIAETLTFYAEELDWSVLVRQAKARSHAAPIFCALYTARKLLGSKIGDEVLDRLRPADMDDDQLSLFIDRKVLDLEPWFFHELVEPTENAGWNLAKASLRRLLPEARFLREKYWDQSAVSGLGRLYRFHLAELSQSLLGTAGGGRRLREHFRVDRWMHRRLTESS
jgi:hypothetical protein